MRGTQGSSQMPIHHRTLPPSDQGVWGRRQRRLSIESLCGQGLAGTLWFPGLDSSQEPTGLSPPNLRSSHATQLSRLHGDHIMTARRPPGIGWESWIDRQIREAEERGEFDDLPGAGEPLRDLDKPFDALWWVKDKLRREDLTYMSPSVALRKEARDALVAASHAESEAEVRQIIADVNEQIREANVKGISGPSLMLVPYDVERVVRDWRERHSR
jgi:hypothetical protein